MSDSLRLLYAGTPQFAVPALQALSRSDHHVVGVLTRPDKPAGRGRQVSESAVKAAARRLGIPVAQPATLRDPDTVAALAAHAADALVVAAYGLLLPAPVLALPRHGCINIHASLLPRWRGAAPIQRALQAGDAESGISIMRMEQTLDTGPVYLRKVLRIAPAETAASLHDRLALLGADAILEVMDAIAAGTAIAEPQQGPATYAARIEKAEARIDWSLAAVQIERQVRAFNPWPIAETAWGEQTLRIWAAHLEATPHHVRPGTVLSCGPAGIVVACGEGALALDVVQLASRRPLPVREFLNAHDVQGATLGSAH